MLENEYFVFTGTLTTMTRKQAQSIITGLKGHNQNAATKRTTRLGQEIIIMNEKEFINFLSQRFYLLSLGL